MHSTNMNKDIYNKCCVQVEITLKQSQKVNWSGIDL